MAKGGAYGPDTDTVTNTIMMRIGMMMLVLRMTFFRAHQLYLGAGTASVSQQSVPERLDMWVFAGFEIQRVKQSFPAGMRACHNEGKESRAPLPEEDPRRGAALPTAKAANQVS